MPSLRCSAESCYHNNDQYCCRGKINVAGQGAGTSEETCCANYYEAQGNARDAVDQNPTPEMEIACEAHNCTHNVDCKCHADSVDVSGFGANKKDDTCCSSFYPE